MTEAITLDEIDEIATSAFEGYVVRKDLAQQFKGAYPVPTYVGEFLIGRYCATTDPEEIEEGLQVVRRLLADRTVRAGEEELFKSRARERMTIKLIDLVKARLDAKSNAYVAELPSLGLRDVRIDDAVVRDNERIIWVATLLRVSLPNSHCCFAANATCSRDRWIMRLCTSPCGSSSNAEAESTRAISSGPSSIT